jgi:TonB family protein
VLKTEQEFSPTDLLAAEDRSLLRREKKAPASIVDAAKLDTPMRPLMKPLPEYPLTLRNKVDHGAATIELLIDAEGHARLPRIIDTSDPAFGYAAVQAVAQWLFEPPKSGGKAVVARVRVAYEFKLELPVMGTAVGVPPAAGNGE